MSRSVAIHVAAGFLVLTSTLVNADGTRYEWSPVSNAAYYQGTVSRDGEATNFRTQSNWVLFTSDANIKLGAYDAADRWLSDVTPKITTFAGANIDPDVLPPPILPPPPTDQLPPPIADESDDAALDEATDMSDISEGDTTEDVSDEEEQDDDAVAKPSAADDAASANDSDIRRRMNGYATVQLGVGKEWLEASGGVSNYDGNANVGGTIVSGAAVSENSPWSFPALLAAHNFSTKVNEAQDGTTKESTAKFLRLTARAGAAFDLFRGTGKPSVVAAHGMTVGAGISYLRLPLLAIDSDLLGTASLENNAALGPYIGVGYTRYFDADNIAGFDFSQLPTTLSKGVKALSSSSLLYWRHVVAARLYMELGFVVETTSITAKVDCPNVNGCQKASQSSDRLIQARLGVGSRF